MTGTALNSLQSFCHEVRILLSLVELENDAGPDETGMFRYQIDKVYGMIRGFDNVDQEATK